MKVLVTGGTGFAGRHLVRELINNGYEVSATSTHQESLEFAEVLNIDLTNTADVNKLNLQGYDAVFNLAGLAAVGPSFAQPTQYLRVNSEIQINLFEACLEQKVNPRFLIVSSANIYCVDDLPLTEDSRLLPVSPYALSKITQEYIGEYYSTRGFEVVIARSFNHMGPGQLEGFIVADLSKQIAHVEKGLTSVVRVGNLDAKRDYTDVRDIVRAYRLLIERGKPGEIYNVCSGSTTSGHEILEGLLKNAPTDIKTEKDPSLLRPTDKPEIYGSNEKIKNDTGWEPEIPLERTLNETLDYWRSKI